MLVIEKSLESIVHDPVGFDPPRVHHPVNTIKGFPNGGLGDNHNLRWLDIGKTDEMKLGIAGVPSILLARATIALNVGEQFRLASCQNTQKSASIAQNLEVRYCVVHCR